LSAVGAVKRRCSTNRCQCRRAGLLCTDLCHCSDDPVSVRISMTTTSISMMRTKVMRKSVVMSEGLRNGSKYMTVCFFLGYFKEDNRFSRECGLRRVNSLTNVDITGE